MKENKIVVHCGGEIVDLEALGQVEIPEATDTYCPVGHRELAEMVKTTSTELLRLPLKQEHYALANNGARMFGLQVYGENGRCRVCDGDGCNACNFKGWEEEPEFGLSVAFRSSYDKSMSLALALGYKVFICDNLAISGEVQIVRKHTKNVWSALDQILVHTLYRKRPEMEDKFHTDVERFKRMEVGRRRGWRFLGLAMGEKVLSATQLNIAFRQWNALDHEGKMPHNAWDLYNACTAAMKSTPFNRVMEAHRDLHHLIGHEL